MSDRPTPTIDVIGSGRREVIVVEVGDAGRVGPPGPPGPPGADGVVGGGIPEPPSDGGLYARTVNMAGDGAWEEIGDIDCGFL